MAQPVVAIRKSIESINNPEVLQMIEKLSNYGLSVAVPHMHDSKGSFEELPRGMISLEENLSVSFKDVSEVDSENTVPVMWRWNEEGKEAEVVARCGLECLLG